MTGKNHLRGFDGLRGLLAILVAYAHSFGHITGWSSGLSFVGDASFAVDVFFAMSAVVLWSAYQQRLQSFPLGWAQFFVIRAFRLWPLHAATVVFIFSIFFFSQGRLPDWISAQPLSDAVGNAVFLNGLVGVKSINHPAWSISSEFWVGSIFMMACFALPRTAPVVFFCSGLLAAVFFPFPMCSSDALVFGGFSAGAIRCCIAMGSGLLIFRVFRFFCFGGLLVNFVAMVGIIVILYCIIDGPVVDFWLYFAVLGFASLFLAALPDASWVNYFFESPAPRFLGVFHTRFL